MTKENELVKPIYIIISSFLTCIILIIANFVTLASTEVSNNGFSSVSITFALTLCLVAVEFLSFLYNKPKGVKYILCVIMIILYSLIALLIFVFTHFIVIETNKIVMQNATNSFLSLKGINISIEELNYIYIFLPLAPPIASIGFEIPWRKISVKHINKKKHINN